MTLRALLLFPACLSLLLLGAHFLRGGHVLAVGLLLASLLLLWVRLPAARRLLQVVLLLGAGEWLRTLWLLARLRLALGEPWLRMALILGAVALVTAASALLLQTRLARDHFRAR